MTDNGCSQAGCLAMFVDLIKGRYPPPRDVKVVAKEGGWTYPDFMVQPWRAANEETRPRKEKSAGD
jgi:hypothetical protein